MENLHQKDYIHRDLKPENILITKELNSKITDFGISKKIGEENSNTKTMKVGTSFYMAPEVVLTNNYSFKCDIFSYSIIMFQLLTERLEDIYDSGIENEIEKKLKKKLKMKLKKKLKIKMKTMKTMKEKKLN